MSKTKKEVEIRFSIQPKEKKYIKTLLNKLNWNPILKEEKDTYFCHKDYTLSKTTKQCPYIIRMRVSNKTKILAYKSFDGKGSWIEIETKVDNDKSMIKILNLLNQFPYLEISKKRYSGKIKNIEINIDEIKNLGSFIECEIISNNVEKSKEQILNFAKNILHITEDRIIHEGYVQLMEKINENK